MISSHTTSAQRLALWIRSGGKCERCGNKQPRKGWDAHHRIKQSLGGLEALSNLVMVCRGCHNTIHRGTADRTGWLVKSWLDPLVVPILMHDGWRLADDEGSTRRVDSPLPP